MKSIGVCIVVNKDDCFLKTNYCIHNLVSKIRNANVNLYILSNNCSIEMSEYLAVICSSYINETENPKKTENFIHLHEEINIYSAYNKLMLLVNDDYTCLMPNGLIINEFWYSGLLNYAEKIKNSGIISIQTGLDKTFYTSTITDKETMELIVKPDNEYESLTGIYFISSSAIRVIGGFEKKLENTGYETEEFCWRYHKNGFVNYYLPKHNSIPTIINNSNKTEEGRERFALDIREKIKSRIYKSQF